MNFYHKRIAILGLSLTGISVATYLSGLGVQCILSELRKERPEDSNILQELRGMNVVVEMGGHSDEIFNCDLAVVSPGIPYEAPVIKKLKEQNIETISDIELFYRLTKTPIIAVTGSNGKTTVTALIEKVLTKSGYKAYAIGNIGLPVMSYLNKPADYYVVELSSYQLYYSPTIQPKISVYTNYSADHIEWHKTEGHYKLSKENLFKRCSTKDWVILNGQDPVVSSIEEKTQGTIFWFNAKRKNGVYLDGDGISINKDGHIESIIRLKDIQLLGTHNYENVMAAIAVASILEIPFERVELAIKEFKGVEHRLEIVSTVKGIKFYNDSKATNPESAISAIKALQDRDIILIAGGKDKGTDLTNFSSHVKEHVMSVVLLGEAVERFEGALKSRGYSSIYKVNGLNEAVMLSYKLAQETTEGVVLFSPGCASFDMFKNFEERGRVFKEYVRHLHE